MSYQGWNSTAVGQGKRIGKASRCGSPNRKGDGRQMAPKGLFVMRTYASVDGVMVEVPAGRDGDDLRELRANAERALGTHSAKGPISGVVIVHPHGTSDALSLGETRWSVDCGRFDRPDHGLEALELVGDGQGLVETASS